MRVVIFCDMEGIACIEHWDQVSAGKPFYEECRKLYTDEMNAAVRGARAAGAGEIIVVDCHGAGGAYSFKSFIAERLESGAQYVFGYPWARYIAAFEQGCDAILFVGAHAMAGTPDGVLCHTVSSEAWYNAWINDTLVGESGILAAIAGCWDVPAIFVSGDEATCREVRTLLGEPIPLPLGMVDGGGWPLVQPGWHVFEKEVFRLVIGKTSRKAKVLRDHRRVYFTVDTGAAPGNARGVRGRAGPGHRRRRRTSRRRVSQGLGQVHRLGHG